MPINPVSKIDRNVFTADLSVPDTADIFRKFPPNLGNDGENRPAMLFKFHSAVPGETEPRPKDLQGNGKFLALPLPAELPFTDSYNYDDSSSLQDYATWIKNMVSRAEQNLGSIFGGDGADLGNRKKGRETNSQAAIIFKNPNFRTFSFSWELVARSKLENIAIQTAVYAFRLAAASHFQDGDATAEYLEYPSLVSFVIYPGGDSNPFPASYPCFIESVSYAPVSQEGQIPFFKDGVPVGWKLSIVLKESMYLDRDDIVHGLDNNQGF